MQPQGNGCSWEHGRQDPRCARPGRPAGWSRHAADRAEQAVVESDASPDLSSQASKIKIMLDNSTVHATPGLKQAEPTC
jgi:hypothetical protein